MPCEEELEMKNNGVITVFVGLYLLSGSCANRDSGEQSVSGSQDTRQGVAILITGAAARISQEAALLEELDARKLLKDVVFIAGVSSGALNAVALNGVLSGKIAWEDYRKILFRLKDSDIFIQNGAVLPVNTEPARALFRHVAVDLLGYEHIGDLPITTALSITRMKDLGFEKTAYRMSSRRINAETDTTLDLVDILMASSAFPLVFPIARIQRATTIPDVGYVDGGFSEDNVPYRALLEFEAYRGVGVERVYIVSRNNGGVPEISEELKRFGINDHGVFDRLGVNFDSITNRKMTESLEKFTKDAPELASRTFVWKPDFAKDFPLFSFDTMQTQYDLTV
ncbi:MAG: patatin-like phospholipase family protein, partial [Spirochaetales bacterium]